MKCRALKDKNIIWFKSYGVDESNGTIYKYNSTNEIWEDEDIIVNDLGTNYKKVSNSWYKLQSGSWVLITVYEGIKKNPSNGDLIFLGKAKKVDVNYSEEQDGVVDSLTQRLSVIKGELWYQINYGIPLLEKGNDKAIYDFAIIDMISKQPDVLGISKFKSEIIKNKYIFDATINTKYGDIDIKQIS